MQFTQLLEVFQQIDVEEAYDNSSGSAGRLRMYGVTEVFAPFMFPFLVIDDDVSSGREQRHGYDHRFLAIFLYQRPPWFHSK